jgi:hypothetical protein
MPCGPVAADGEEIVFGSAGEGWVITWYRPESVPDGQPHGANAWCLTGDSETLRREMLEETCTRVRKARLLGFTRSNSATTSGWRPG